MKIHNRDLVITAVYAPKDDASYGIKENFKENIADVLNVTSKKEIIMISDFNARTKHKGNYSVVGKYREATINDNGAG